LWREDVSLDDDDDGEILIADDPRTFESVVGSPPFAEEDRRGRSAVQDQQQQGDRPESKLGFGSSLESPTAMDGSPFLPEVVLEARKKYARFCGVAIGEVSEEAVANTSLGIAGWSDPQIGLLDDKQATPWTFGDLADGGDGSAENVQIAKLIEVLGASGEGKRAVLKAVAKQFGIVDEDELRHLYNGTSDRKLNVPRSLRDAMCAIGLNDIMAPINILEVRDGDAVYVNEEAWRDIEFEVALDSGSVVHVCSLEDVGGYKLEESAGSRRGQEFLMGDGGTIPNLGQCPLNLTDDGTKRDLQSTFQIAAVTRPLMSVGKICDGGHTVTFSNVMAVVHAADGSELARFQRNQNGLYIAKLKLRNPAGFPRQE
jgi:hypothetical protein